LTKPNQPARQPKPNWPRDVRTLVGVKSLPLECSHLPRFKKTGHNINDNNWRHESVASGPPKWPPKLSRGPANLGLASKGRPSGQWSLEELQEGGGSMASARQQRAPF